jgi:hypothetical protein
MVLDKAAASERLFQWDSGLENVAAGSATSSAFFLPSDVVEVLMKTSATMSALVEALQLTARNRPSDRNAVLLCQLTQRYLQELEARLVALEARGHQDSGAKFASGELNGDTAPG